MLEVHVKDSPPFFMFYFTLSHSASVDIFSTRQKLSKLDTATQQEERVLRAGTRVRDPFVLTVRSPVKVLS